MSFFRKIFFAFHGCLFVLTSGVSAQDQIVLPYTETEYETSDVGLRKTYGRVVYHVDFAVDSDNPNAEPHAPSVEKSLQSFLRDAVSKTFGSENGNYVLTLSLLSGTREVAKKAVLSFSYSERNFLFFTTERSLSGNLSRSGVLTDNFPVTRTNNLLNVQLRLQKSDSAFVDTDTFNQFSEQASLLSFEVLQPALELLPSMQTALGVMAIVVDSTEEVDISNDVAMRFVQAGADAPSEIIYSIRGPLKRQEFFVNGVNVRVTFETEDSLFENFEDGKFEEVDFATTLPFAVVGASAAALPFEDSIGAKRYETVRSYLAALQRGAFPADATANSVCRELWDTLLEFFTVDDAPLIYASFLRRYDFELNTSGAKRQCLDRYSQSFVRLGIPADQISISQ